MCSYYKTRNINGVFFRRVGFNRFNESRGYADKLETIHALEDFIWRVIADIRP